MRAQLRIHIKASLLLHFIMINPSESQPWAIILAEIPNEFSNCVLCIGALDISNYSQTCAAEAVL